MGLTRAEFRGRVRTLLNEDKPSLYKDEEINEWLNDGQRDIATKVKCIESTSSVSLANGTASYSFTGIDVIAAHYSTTSLLRITPKQYGHIKENSTEPQFYFIWNSKIYVVPVPAASGTLSLFTALDSTDFANDTSTSTLPIEFERLVILYSTYRGLIKAGRFAQASSVYGIYMRELSYHQSADAGAYKETDSIEDYRMPDKYTSVQGQNPQQQRR